MVTRNTQTGLIFEQKVSLVEAWKQLPGYRLELYKDLPGLGIFFKNKYVGHIFIKNEFHLYLKRLNIDIAQVLSKKLIPDTVIFEPLRRIFYIVEMKFQSVAGSVDEKLQTCDYKRKQYLRILEGRDLRVEFVYLLSDWFKKDEYRDVLTYIYNVGCSYKFDEIRISWFGFPEPDG